MARRPNTEAPEATTEVTETEATVETTEATEAPATETPAEPDLTAFTEALDAAIESRDSTTGDVPEANVEPVVLAYRKLDGLKAKNAAKRLVEEAMKTAMTDSNLSLARANLEISKRLTSGPVSSGSSTREPAKPVDPTEAYVELVSGLVLAAQLVQEAQPEGVAESWAEQVQTQVSEAGEKAEAFRAWFTSDAEDKGDAPETPAFVQAAVKLALGKSAKVGATRRASSASPFTGERRDVGEHIKSAFEGVEVGTFLTVAEIRKHTSAEYGQDSPSAGAVSARLFPKSGKVTIPGVEPGTNDKGVKGATKVAV